MEIKDNKDENNKNDKYNENENCDEKIQDVFTSCSYYTNMVKFVVLELGMHIMYKKWAEDEKNTFSNI
jgi:hypothetical protein